MSINSKRILKEFQLRYCVDMFDALVIELKHFLDNFTFQTDIFATLINYFKNVNFFLTLNKIPNEPQCYSIPINTVIYSFFSLSLFLNKFIIKMLIP